MTMYSSPLCFLTGSTLLFLQNSSVTPAFTPVGSFVSSLGKAFIAVLNSFLGYRYFFGDAVAFKAAGANFNRKSGAFDFGFYFYQVGFPGTPGAVFGMAYFITGSRMFSAKLTGPRHYFLPYSPAGLCCIVCYF